MGLRSLLALIVVQALLVNQLNAKSLRFRRDTPSITVDNNPNKRDVVVYSASSLSESQSYHPPLLAAPPAASVARSIDQNPYQPPLLLSHSNNNDYKPLISSSQTQSVRYQAPGSNIQLQGLPLAYAQSQSSATSQSYSAPNSQTGNSNAVPRQGFSYNGEHGSLNNFNHQHPPAQAESQPAPTVRVSAGDKNKDEYVIYYYYYYDNDTSANGTSNFDDIPSLESYDMDKIPKGPEKIAGTRALGTDVNSLNGNSQDYKRAQDGGSSQPRSASSGISNQAPFIRSDRPGEDLTIQPLKPVSNVYRYGTNEVPRFPILPNFVVSESPVTKIGIVSIPADAFIEEKPTTPTSLGSGIQAINPVENESDDANVVLDQPSDVKSEDNKVTVEEPQTTTTTEDPTTTEIPTTTTTEKSRRRPGAGNRRRFNPSPSFSSSRRQGLPRSSSTTSTTTTTPSSGVSTTRGSFRGSNRVRPRPTIPSSRPRPSFSRNAPVASDNEDVKSTPSSVSSTTTTAKPRFGVTSAAPRRFSSSRTRSQAPAPARIASSTTSTTTLRPRISSRPRPSFAPSSRARPPRPGLFRSRTPEPEDPETTTLVSETVVEEESSASSPNQNSSSQPNDDSESDEELSSEEEETSITEADEPTTTEKSRFSALFRPRNRSTLNRPRPPVARRSS